MEEQENQWFAALEYIVKYAQNVKCENDILMSKTLNKTEIDRVSENTELSYENLIEHKKIIQNLIGNLFSEKHKNEEFHLKIKTIEDEANMWIKDWNILRENNEINVFFTFCNLEKRKE